MRTQDVNHVVPGVTARPVGEDRPGCPTRLICVVHLVSKKIYQWIDSAQKREKDEPISTSSRSKHAINLWRRFTLNDCSRLSFSEGSPWCGDDDRERCDDDEDDSARSGCRAAGRLTRRSGSALLVSQGTRKRKTISAYHSRFPLRPYARRQHPGAPWAGRACRRTRRRDPRTPSRARPRDRARHRAAQSCRQSRPSARSSTRFSSSSAWGRSCPRGAGTTNRGSAR